MAGMGDAYSMLSLCDSFALRGSESIALHSRGPSSDEVDINQVEAVYLLLRLGSRDIFPCLPTAQEVPSLPNETGVVHPLPISLDSYSTCSEYMTFI